MTHRRRLPVVRPASMRAGVITLVVASVAVAVFLRGPAGLWTPGVATGGAPLDLAYKFDAAGSLPLAGPAELPVRPGSIVAHWYTFRGWDVVRFEALDLRASGPLCVGTSVLNAATHQVEHLSNAPTAAGACDPAGAGQVTLASPDRGVRACGAVVSTITGIPGETAGVLYASLIAFRGDGTGVGLSSRLETTTGPSAEIDPTALGCGPLPLARATSPTATPAPVLVATPAPASTGSVAAGDRVPPPSLTQPRGCAPLGDGELQEVTDTAAAPYFIHRPTLDDRGRGAPTVAFLAGGSGGRSSAQRMWEILFAGRAETSRLQVALPYAIDVNFVDEASRTLTILNEVLSCYGGDPMHVHLAGTSNGGLAAFALMAAQPEYFATLLGAPGAFPVQDPATIDPAILGRTLAGRAVLNGVGALDSAWKPEVIATHNALARAGIESVYVEFAGAGHVLNATLDPGAFFDFWESH